MPRYTEESLQKLRERIDLVELLTSHISLKKSGSSYKSLCPFHEEKSPSFTVQRGDSHYHCFGCGAHGDAIAFVMHYLNYNFTEAVEYLAERFHVALEMNQERQEDKGLSKSILKEALEMAAEFFQCYLLYTEEGQEALSYLYARGITLDFIYRFGLGLAPRTVGMMKRILQARQVKEETLFQAGLLAEGGKEFFRERITFPIKSATGQVIGFSARKYHEETFGGKYINTPETPVFHKSHLLFGLNETRREIAKQRKAILVEGQIDCLKLIESGFDITVATLGTAFGESHVQLLKQLGAATIYLLFDGDSAGLAASSKAGNLFQKQGLEVKVASLPKGEDPDSFLMKQGAKKLEEKIEEAKDYLSFQIEYLSVEKGSSPAAKAALVRDLSAQIKSWDDPVLVHESLRKVARLLQVPEEIVGVSERFSQPLYYPRRGEVIGQNINPALVLELDLLRWLILLGKEKPQLSKVAARFLTVDHFSIPLCKELFSDYMEAKSQGRPYDLLAVGVKLQGNEELMKELIHKKINTEKAEELFVATVQSLLDRSLQERLEEIKKKMQLANGAEALAYVKEFDALSKGRIKCVM